MTIELKMGVDFLGDRRVIFFKPKYFTGNQM